MSTCPECGCERNDELGCCTACGRLNSDNNEVPQFLRTNRTVKQSNKKAQAMMCAGILIMTVFACILVVGAPESTVDFEGRENSDGYLLTNTSIGLFDRTEWEVTDAEGTVTKIGTGKSVQWPTPFPGVYMITMYAYSFCGMEHIVSKWMMQAGAKVITHEWPFEGKTYKVSVDAASEDFQKYWNYDINRWPGAAVTSKLVREYMQTETSNNIFGSIADQLISQFPAGASKEYRVNVIMSYVQQFDYISDEAKGTSEYWKFPMETLYEGGGDCEDLALLCMALFETVFEKQGESVNVAIALYWGKEGGPEGHAMASIALTESEAPSNYDQILTNGYKMDDGKTYYVAETTSPGWKVGMMGENYISYNLYTPEGMLVRPAAV